MISYEILLLLVIEIIFEIGLQSWKKIFPQFSLAKIIPRDPGSRDHAFFALCRSLVFSENLHEFGGQ